MGPSATRALLKALSTSQLSCEINHTFITLIPNKKQSTFIVDYRPISLCNVVYKLFSKVIDTRLRSLLPRVISESQSIFVSGRQITGNILVAYEIIHFLRIKNKGKEGFISLKMDMSKSYDIVE